MKTKIMLTMSLMALLAVTAGYGQGPKIKAKIDFPFTVEGMVLPAGQYEFERNDLRTVFRVTGEGKNSTVVPILTRVAGAMHTSPQDAHLMFDVVEGTYFLSEIWIPDEDGYVMLATKAKHEHRVININVQR